MSIKPSRLARHMPVSAILLLLFLPATRAAAASLDVGPGIYYVRFLELPDSTTPASLFGEALPGGSEWKLATRLLTADQPSPLGCFYNRDSGEWEGTLTTLTTGRGYWLALPWDAPRVHLELDDVRLEAGIAPWSSGNGVLIRNENGITTISPSGPPPSTATHQIVKKRPATITATSGVYIQQPPPGAAGAGAPGSALPSTTGSPSASTTSRPAPWVKVKLDTLYGHGAEEAWVPLAGQGTVTVPPPADFDVPPWGKGPVPTK